MMQVLEEITVSTGQFKLQSLKESVHKIKVITAEQIKAKAAINLFQVLNTELGLRFSNDNTLGVMDVQLMGMSGRSIKILLDGVPLLDRNDTRESLNQVNIENIERIEIIEGPMSVIYGSDALAGVINIITKRKSGDHFSGNVRIHEETAGNEYSPWGNRGNHLQSINASYNKNSFFVSGALTHNDLRGFGGDEFGRDKTWLPKKQLLGNIIVGHQGAKNTIYYRLDGLDETITERGAINMNTYTAFDQRFLARRWMHQLQNDWNISEKFQLNASVAYTDYSRRTRSTRHDFTTGHDELSTGAGQQDTAKFASVFLRVLGHYQPNQKLALQPGIEVNRNEASGQRIAGNPVITDYALFASAEWKPVSQLNIRPGLRFIKNSIYDAPPIMPALNVKYSLSEKLDLRGSYAKGYRAPALRELYFDFVDANHAIFGNQTLKAETSNSFNASLQRRNRTAMLKTIITLSGFYNVFDDLIAYAQDPEDATKTMLFNVDKFKTTGASIDYSILVRDWEINCGALLVGRYNSLSTEEKLGENVPDFNWSPEANANIFFNVSKIKTRLGIMYKFTGRRQAYQQSGTSETEVSLVQMDSFNWADFTATKTMFKTLDIQAGVKNIFDVTNINSTAGSGGTHSSGGPIPIGYGRSYFLGISFQFK